MTHEEKIAELRRMLSDIPEILSPAEASRCSPYGKNKIYELIKTKELPAFTFQGKYILAKKDLIECIVRNSDTPSNRVAQIKTEVEQYDT